MAMPVTTRSEDIARFGGDADHWKHVMENLFMPAARDAGFRPIPPKAEGSDLIHDRIIQQLIEADMVLVDLSTHNPNVFFELGVRTSLNKPIALVRDEHTDLPFDTGGINTYTYSSQLVAWQMDQQKTGLTDHLTACDASCDGKNPLWEQFGLKISAAQPPIPSESPTDAKLDLLSVRLMNLESHLREDRLRQEYSREKLSSTGAVAAPYSPDYNETPALRYQGVVNQYAYRQRLSAYVNIKSPTSVTVVFDGGIGEIDLKRLRDLADQHEVAVEFAHRGGGNECL